MPLSITNHQTRSVPPDRLAKMRKVMAFFAQYVEDRLALPKNKFLAWTGFAAKYGETCYLFITARLYQKNGRVPLEIKCLFEPVVVVEDTLKRVTGVDSWIFTDSVPFNNLVGEFVSKLS